MRVFIIFQRPYTGLMQDTVL